MTANVFIPWSDEERELLRQLHENGLSHGDIASTIGRSKNSVSRQIARLGLIPHARGGVGVVTKAAAAKAKHQRPGPPRAPRTTLPPLPSLQDQRCSICGWIVSPTIPHPCLDRITRVPPQPSLLELPKGREAARRDERDE